VSLRVVVLDEDRETWDKAFAALPERLRDVYFSSGYLRLWQRNGDGRAHGAIFAEGESTVLYPFLLRDLSEAPHLGARFAGLHDIQTPYGYGGPLLAGPDTTAIERFRRSFVDWCRRQGVVSEFVRFHPLLDTHRGMAPLMTLREANTTVWCRLAGSSDERLESLGASTRRGVRKARQAGLRFSVETSDEAYERFAELYRATMARREAADYYLFDDPHFASFRELLGDHQSLLCVRCGDTIVAAALFMRSPAFVHYHLGGSDAAALSLRPNNLLFFEAMDWGNAAGAEALHLGGGYHPDDDLFRFKAGFSPLRARFYTGRLVHLADEYERAAAARAAAAPLTDTAYFPAYRTPFPRPDAVG